MFSTHQRLNVKHASVTNPHIDCIVLNIVTSVTSLAMFKAMLKGYVTDVKSESVYPLPSKDFCNWLAGVTDGDGSFSFSVNKKRASIWNCTFKIAQSTYNSRLLYFIKENLQYGGVNRKAGKHMAEFRIRDREILTNLVVPLFAQHPLYSTKHFYFLRWVKALQVLESEEWTTAEKNKILTGLKSQLPTNTYVSPAWDTDSPSNEWVCGFVEAEASLFITRKGGGHQSSTNLLSVVNNSTTSATDRLVHAFGVTQKLDGIILEFLRTKFHISSKVLLTKRNVYRLETTNSRSLLRIESFLFNKLKGVKSLEYRIWSRSLNFKGDFNKLLKAQSLLRKIRTTYKRCVTDS